MKVALVGLGYWGEKILRNLITIAGTEHVVAVDVRRERVEHFSQFYPGVGVASTLDEALDNPEVKGVIIATPLESHAALALKALAAGRPVLIEKPLAASSAEAEAIVELAHERNLNVMVGHTFLFSPRLDAVTTALERNKIGQVHYVTASRLNLGLFRSDTNVIWDLAPHDMSIIFQVLGEFPVLAQTTAQSSVRANVPDVAFISLRFPSGAIASIAVSWRSPLKVRNTVIVGDRGMIVYDDTQADEPVKIYDRGVETIEPATFGEHQLTYRYGDTVAPHVSSGEPLRLELHHFLDCIRSGEPCRSDGRFGLEVVKALEAADQSWRTGGHPVTIEATRTRRSA